MARRGMRGQLHMFDFVHSLDAEASGEVEMVSLMPDFDETDPIVDKENVAMSRRFQIDGKEVEIAYINYNKVRITREGEAPIIKEFTSTKEAVDFYVEQIQEEDTDE